MADLMDDNDVDVKKIEDVEKVEDGYFGENSSNEVIEFSVQEKLDLIAQTRNEINGENGGDGFGFGENGETEFADFTQTIEQFSFVSFDQGDDFTDFVQQNDNQEFSSFETTSDFGDVFEVKSSVKVNDNFDNVGEILKQIFPNDNLTIQNGIPTPSLSSSQKEILQNSSYWKFFKEDYGLQRSDKIRKRQNLLKKLLKDPNRKNKTTVPEIEATEETKEEFNEALYDLLSTMSLEELDIALLDVSVKIQETSNALVKELEVREQLTHDLGVQNELVSFLAEKKTVK